MDSVMRTDLDERAVPHVLVARPRSDASLERPREIADKARRLMRKDRHLHLTPPPAHPSHQRQRRRR